ncbi:PLP-dependent aminotransferase family protein [Microvirga sp.]|uniref:aminotransferase-like domain-containing protein n=1 Tax=Microvirga sp. TaxID=1873136 RepID=UPI0028A9E0B9|nr:PLP-dependent aminotransferase family protein [Microvirga sp.]
MENCSKDMIEQLIQSGTKARRQSIVSAVIDGIARRKLAPGEKLPPQRDLAHHLGVAVGTVGRAYAELETQGFVISHVGRGTFIADMRTARTQNALQLSEPIDMAVYRVPVPPLDDVFGDTLKAMAAEHRPDQILGSAPAAGRFEHREAFAHWLKRFGVFATPDQIVLTNGGQHAMMSAISTITHPGEVIATEEFTDPRMKMVVSHLDRQLVGIPVDQHGLLPEALDQICRTQTIAAIYCTTRSQNPTNITLRLERRQAIAEIARRYDLPVIESDVYGTIMADVDPPIFALAPERTHFISSLGRIAGPGMKIGCLVSPPDKVAQTQSGVGMSTGAATLIMAELGSRWITEGRIDEMIRWQQAEMLRRVSLIATFPVLGQARAIPTSSHVWLTLPEPWRAEEFVAAAAAHGVTIAPSHSFVVGRRSVPHAVRLVIASPPSMDLLETACERLERLLNTQPRIHGDTA